ncbi:MAG: PHP domain-containing protein [Clostridia bacterium]|nr:PHP domain-containing protein [Clostridia bacterium]
MIYGDYHTHSTYSSCHHGKNTIAEMVDSAKTKGLTNLAITDHGPKHVLFGIKRKNIDKARKEIDEINKKLAENDADSSLKKVYLGIEANLMSADGSIDLKKEEIDKLDILLVGYHRGTLNSLRKPLLNDKKQKERYTKAYVNMVYKYDVDIITHPCEYIKVDCKRLAEACAKTDTLIELNTRHFRFTDEDILEMLKTDVKFIISSDAHKKSRIACVDHALAMARKYGLEDRVVNLDGTYLPKKFRKEEKNK